MTIRKNYAEGYFYPKDKEELEELLNKIHECELEHIHYNYSEKRIIGGVVPHAGYIYSAPEAIHFFEIVKKAKEHYDTIVIINPSHTGIGEEISLTSSNYWDSPYGRVEVDSEFQGLLDLPVNNEAQKKEHSGEVMLPLLKHYIDYEFKIVPICFKNQNYENAKLLAKKIYDASKKINKNILIIASSDFSHYVQADMGRKLDDIALKQINHFDSKKLEEEINKYNISICGFGPIMALMEYSKLYHSEPKSVILRRGHSGEVKDMVEVVDYVSILFYGE